MKQIWSPNGKRTACIFRPELIYGRSSKNSEFFGDFASRFTSTKIAHEHLALVGTWNRVGQTNVYLDANMNKFTYCMVE